MFKRLVPATALASALLLAATTLLAKEAAGGSAGFEIRKNSKQPTYETRPPGAAPVSTPATPGDDDMPNRDGGRNARGLPVSNGSQVSSEPRDGAGWGRGGLEAGLYWELIRKLIFLR
jgi:hypothetical protein